MRDRLHQLFGRLSSRKPALTPPAPASSSHIGADPSNSSLRRHAILDENGLTPDFQYENIDDVEIRLLTIIPSVDGNGSIRCFLTSYDRNEHPGYAAISYTWGDVTKKRKIECNGMALEVGRNCEAALRALRNSAQPQTVWIDAICINQADFDEREAQVANIGEVFRRATSTFIFLGESNQQWGVFDDIPNSQWQGLLKRPWFHRTWVIQELLLSRNIVVLIGSDRITWPDLVALCEARRGTLELPELLSMRTEFMHEYARRPPKSWHASCGDILADEDDGDDVMDALDGTANHRERHRPQAGSSIIPRASSFDHKVRTGEHREPIKETGNVNLNYWRLPEILEMTQDFRCHDPRDVIFAILPLFCKPIPELLRPDYRKSVDQVYTDLAWFLIEQGDLAALKHVTGSFTMGIPSWTTYWPGPLLEYSLCLREDRPLAKAGFGSAARDIRAKRIGEDGNLIQLRGVIVGSIASTHVIRVLEVGLPSDEWVGSLTVIAESTCTSHSSGHLLMKWTWSDWFIGGNAKIRAMIDAVTSCMVRALKRDYTEHAQKIASSVMIEEVDLTDMSAVWVSLWCPSVELGTGTVLSVWDEDNQLEIQRLHLPADSDGRLTFAMDGENYDITRQDISAASGIVFLRPGDTICVFLGFEYPFALRKFNDSQWQLLGECAVTDQDVMDGKLVDCLDCSTLWSEPCPKPLQDFVIC